MIGASSYHGNIARLGTANWKKYKRYLKAISRNIS